MFRDREYVLNWDLVRWKKIFLDCRSFKEDFQIIAYFFFPISCFLFNFLCFVFNVLIVFNKNIKNFWIAIHFFSMILDMKLSHIHKYTLAQ